MPAQWVLTDNVPGDPPPIYSFYRPLETQTGLYLRFKETDADDRESILAFANKYGMLGVGMLAAAPIRSVVEIMADWKEEIRKMQQAVDIWDLVNRGDAASLSRNFEELGPGNWLYRITYDGLERLDRIEPVGNLFVPGNIFVPAGFLVQRWINRTLASSTSPQVLYDVERGRRAFKILPRSLLGAMWLQFAQTIDGTRMHRHCKERSG
jgi:hypothetical protein